MLVQKCLSTLQTYTELVRLVCMELLHSSLIVIKLEPSSSFAFILKPSKAYIRKVLGTYVWPYARETWQWLIIPFTSTSGPPPAICDTCTGNVKARPVSFILLPSQWPEYKLREVSALSVIKRDHCWKTWVSCTGNRDEHIYLLITVHWPLFSVLWCVNFPCFTKNIGLLKRCTTRTARSDGFIWLPIDFMKKVITSCSLVCSQWITNAHLRPSASAGAFAALTCKWDNQLNCWLCLYISMNEKLAFVITILNRSLITIS